MLLLVVLTALTSLIVTLGFGATFASTVALVDFWSLPLLTSGVAGGTDTSARLVSVPTLPGLTVSCLVTATWGARSPSSQRRLSARGRLHPAEALTKVAP